MEGESEWNKIKKFTDHGGQILQAPMIFDSMITDSLGVDKNMIVDDLEVIFDCPWKSKVSEIRWKSFLITDHEGQIPQVTFYIWQDDHRQSRSW